MKIRVITSIAALAVFAVVLLAPPIVFTIVLAAVILMMLYECYSATKADAAMKAAGFVSAALVMFSMWFRTTSIGAFLGGAALHFCVGIIVLLNVALVVIKHGKYSYKDILSNGFLAIYVTFSMMCIWLVRHYYDTENMLMIFICAWSTDTFAYFSGRAFGKHKLIPHVSPNKTVEGSIGGVIGATCVCIAYTFICSKFEFSNYFVPDYMKPNYICLIVGSVVGLLGGIFSQVGDLAASSIKRDEDIKDFGWIFPGHGGFMDRFDSVMFIAPIILILMMGSVFLKLG